MFYYYSFDPLKREHCVRFPSPAHQQTLGHTAAGCREHGGESLNHEAAHGASEVSRLRDWQRVRRQSRMGKCEEGWCEGGRWAEQKVCQLGSPWVIHLPPPAGGESTLEGEIRWGLSLSHLLVWMQPQLDCWEGKRPDMLNNWDKQHISLKGVCQTPPLKWAFTFWLLCLD